MVADVVDHRAAAVGERITGLGLDEHAEVLGAVPYEQAHEVYRRGEVFVSPTYSEGFSNTLLEAMASGLPTVSTDSVGVVDCLRHEENGLLHAPGDVAGLRAALTRLLDDGALRTRLATTALEEVRRLYSWPVLAASIDTTRCISPDCTVMLPPQLGLP